MRDERVGAVGLRGTQRDDAVLIEICAAGMAEEGFVPPVGAGLEKTRGLDGIFTGQEDAETGGTAIGCEAQFVSGSTN